MLGELIKALETCPDGAVFKEGFHDPHSYRGDYYQLGVEPKSNCTKEELLETLYEALDSTQYGWKGGEFDMHSGVDVYLAYEGCTSNKILTGWGAKSGEGFVLLTEEPKCW